jgi:hypothetical protein
MGGESPKQPTEQYVRIGRAASQVNETAGPEWQKPAPLVWTGFVGKRSMRPFGRCRETLAWYVATVLHAEGAADGNATVKSALSGCSPGQLFAAVKLTSAQEAGKQMMTTHTRFMALGLLAGTALMAMGVYAGVVGDRQVHQDAMNHPVPVAWPPPLIPMALPAPHMRSVYDVMLDTLQDAGLDHDKAGAAADSLSDAVNRAVDDGISASLSTDALMRRAFFPWLAGAIGLTFIITLIGALRRGLAPLPAPEPVAPLMPYEIESLGLLLEEVGCEVRGAEMVRTLLNLGWMPPPHRRGDVYTPPPVVRRVP